MSDAGDAMDVRPVTLEGQHVRLEPLSLRHQAGFRQAGAEWSLSAEQVRDGIEHALRQQELGTALPFATIERASNVVVGGTKYLDISRTDRRLEIGSTWIGQPWRRTAINTEAKLLMLAHAFEQLGCIRVEFKVDALNEPSRAAVLRLGATEEGVLRNYKRAAGGEIHHAVCYSIIASEWPAVRERLRGFLSRPR